MSDNIITDLSYLSIIEVSGADAASFLNNQFTTNVNQLSEHKLQLSAWCNPKGQVKTTFYFYRDAEKFFVLLPEALKISFLKQLGMYILRADVQLHDRSNTLARIGLCSVHSDFLKQLPEELTILSLAPTGSGQAAEPKQKSTRYIIITEVNQVESIQKTLSEHLITSDPSVWKTMDIQAGIPWLSPETSEKFLPQMLNLDSLNALDYQKGCYPGQEVIARLHYRGEVKRQLYRASCAEESDSGDPVFSPDDRNVGMIINSQTSMKETLLLAVIENKSVQGALTLRHVNGPTLNISPLLKQTE